MNAEQIIEKGLKRLDKLQIEKKKHLDEADAIYKVQPVGQPFRTFIRATDRAMKVCEKQAEIWNKIRHYIVLGTSRTLWQIGLAQRLLLETHGSERYLSYSGEDIRQAIKSYKKSQNANPPSN